jgi:hypothetical protein
MRKNRKFPPTGLYGRIYDPKTNQLITESIDYLNEVLSDNGDWLIGECVSHITCEINETSKGPGPLKFKGKFQEANAVNKNRRMYPYDILETNVKRLKEAVANRGLVGELDHPTDSIIHFENSSHLVTKLWWEGNTLMGEGEVLDTPSGKVLRSLINAGVRVGISSRGVGNGSTNEDGVLVIGESYKLITFDAVADPSTFSAFQQKIVSGANEGSIPTIYERTPRKNEASRINTVNAQALITFLGCVFENKTNEIKERLHS